VKHVVGEHQINEGLRVRVHAEVLVVVAAEAFAHSVRVVEHRGDAVEAEAVEAVLLDVPAQVGQQEPQHLKPVPKLKSELFWNEANNVKNRTKTVLAGSLEEA